MKSTQKAGQPGKRAFRFRFRGIIGRSIALMILFAAPAAHSEQPAKDDAAVRSANTTTHTRLRQIGTVAIRYGETRNGLMPPDLGTMVAQGLLLPHEAFSGWSTTQIPADLKTRGPQAIAEWINQNTDFVYIGAGRKNGDLDANFVVAYAKTTPAAIGMTFLLADGHVEYCPVAQSARILAELKAGTNPPKAIAEK